MTTPPAATPANLTMPAYLRHDDEPDTWNMWLVLAMRAAGFYVAYRCGACCWAKPGHYPEVVDDNWVVGGAYEGDAFGYIPCDDNPRGPTVPEALAFIQASGLDRYGFLDGSQRRLALATLADAISEAFWTRTPEARADLLVEALDKVTARCLDTETRALIKARL